MKALTKPLLYLLISAVALYLVFVYAAQLSPRQSVVLAVLFAFLLDGAIHSAPKPTLKFTPYWIRIFPRWHEILTDFRLVQSSEDWKTVQEACGSANSRDFSVFRDALWFSVLRPLSQTEDTLIYLNSYKTFISEVDLLEDLDPVGAVKEDERLDSLRKQKVRLFVKWAMDGYQLGLELPDWWWEKNKGSCQTAAAEENDYRFGTVRVALAILPYGEFGVLGPDCLGLKIQ